METNNNLNDGIEFLKDIGTKLSDFEEVPNDNEKFTLLGKGNFGYAEKMKSKIDNKFYAIKKINMNSKKFVIKDFKRETKIMKDLNHENIIRFYGFFKDKEDKCKYSKIYNIVENEDKEVFCLVLEYAENGSLEYYMKKYKKKFDNENEYVPIEEKTIIKLFKQLLSAVKYLHSKSIMHRDIKPDNILLDKYNNVKISDFGISAIYKSIKEKNLDIDQDLLSEGTRVGRKDFICPEIEHFQEYDYVCDTFSLGLTMLCLMSFKHPIKIVNKNRTINFNNINNSYNFFLRKLVFKLLYGDKNKNEKLSSNDAYNELEIIEIYINNPNNIIAKNCLEEINKNISENMKKEIDLNLANNENNLSYQIFPYNNLLFNQNFFLQNSISYYNNYQINQLNQNSMNFNQSPYYQNQPNLNLVQNSYSENIQSPNSLGQLQQNYYQRANSQSYYQNQFQQNLTMNNINNTQNQNEKENIEFEISDRRKTKIKIEADKNMTLENLINIFHSKLIEKLKLLDINEYRLNGNIPLNINSKRTLSELRIENDSIISVKPPKNDMVIEFEISPEKIFKIEANENMTLENLLEAFKLNFIKESKLIDEEGYRLNGNIPLLPNSLKTLSELKIPNGSKIKVQLKKNYLLIKFILVKNDGKEKEIEIISNEEMIFEELISLLFSNLDEDFGNIAECKLNKNIPINPKSKKTLSFLKIENKSEIKIYFK